MAASQIDTVACPPSRRTFNPDGSRIRAPTAAEQAAEEARFAAGRKRWGDRVGRRPTPPPPSSTKDAQAPSISSDDDDGNAEQQLQKRRLSLDSDRSGATTLLPGKEDGRERGKGGLLRRVFGGKRGGERKVKKPDAYIAAAASWDGNVGGKGEVRRERLGKRGG